MINSGAWDQTVWPLHSGSLTLWPLSFVRRSQAASRCVSVRARSCVFHVWGTRRMTVTRVQRVASQIYSCSSDTFTACEGTEGSLQVICAQTVAFFNNESFLICLFLLKSRQIFSGPSTNNSHMFIHNLDVSFSSTQTSVLPALVNL